MYPATRSLPRKSGVARRSSDRAADHAAALYSALQELLRVYQFRDRDRACYGQVTPNECYALEAVKHARELSVNELAAALGLHKSNASRIAEALVAKGLLARRADARDARARRLRVTARGAAAHAAIRRLIVARYEALLAGTPQALRDGLVGLVRALGAEAAARIGPAGAGSTGGEEEGRCS